MKLQLLIATADKEYGDRLSSALFKHYAETIQANICTDIERWSQVISQNSYDAVLLDSDFLTYITAYAQEEVTMKTSEILFISDVSMVIGNRITESSAAVKKLQKYQRVSFLVQELLSTSSVSAEKMGNMKLTVVWSPAGGTGKTTVALACAAKKTASNRVVYLDLDYFSSVPVYFSSNNRGISWVFQQLDEENAAIHLEGVAETDSATGITFFGPPDNYDDMNILTVEHLKTLLKSLSFIAEEVVIDLPSVCNEMSQTLFEEADKIMIVTDSSQSSKQKLQQFAVQHHIYSTFKNKITVVANKGCILHWEGAQVKLPFVKATDDKVIFKTLATQLLDG